jgi:hypothetical protein
MFVNEQVFNSCFEVVSIKSFNFKNRNRSNHMNETYQRKWIGGGRPMHWTLRPPHLALTSFMVLFKDHSL